MHDGRIISVDLSGIFMSGEVLDIGCRGGGIIYRALKGSNTTRTEEAALTSNCAVPMGTTDWVCGSPDKLPFECSSFDNAAAFFSFSQMGGLRARNKSLREIERVLKPGGNLHIWDINKSADMIWWHRTIRALLPGGDRAEMEIVSRKTPWGCTPDDMVPMIERFFHIDVFIRYEEYFFIRAAKKEG